MRDADIAKRQGGDMVTVGHPNLLIAEMQKWVRLGHIQMGDAIFVVVTVRDFAARLMRQRLHAVADAQNRQVAFQDVILDVGRVLGIDGLRSAGEDDAFGLRREGFGLAGAPGSNSQ